MIFRLRDSNGCTRLGKNLFKFILFDPQARSEIKFSEGLNSKITTKCAIFNIIAFVLSFCLGVGLSPSNLFWPRAC